ncbi:MAG: NAD(P)/FAD-dependent oxidoreductase [Pseudomonadota bacterium]|nr:NAD(P)/FAD-dependent oxidoreductase [Pseudomonadota bacterium]
MHHVIVGNSIAGIEAAIAIRNRDDTARITLISAEHDHFFSRTALMYVFCGQLSVRDTEPYDRELYERMRFTRIRDRVTRVRPADHALDLAGGATVPYDRLLLAVGSYARRLSWPNAYEGPGVHHFVTLQDLAGLDAAAKPGMHAAVIGGGLIGVETAEILHLRGLKVHFLVREPWYFPVALDEAESDVVAAHIRHHGLDVRTGTPADAMERRDGRLVLKLPGEELPVDLVVGAIGVAPNTAFLAGSGIALAPDGAIETTDSLQSTTVPDIWAAGDCANVTWVDGSRRPEQLWYTARDQGRVAARAMLGDEVCYRRGTWYNSAKFFDIEYTTAGFVPFPGKPEKGVAFQASDYRSWYQQVPGTAVTQRIVCKGERVVGFNCLGSRWDHQVFMRWIQERRSLVWVLAHMNEARFDEEFTPPFRVLPTATSTPSGA